MKSLQSFISLIELMRIGLVSGRDLHSILKWIEENFPAPGIRKFVADILSEMRLQESDSALLKVKSSLSSPERKIFLEILKFQTQSQSSLASALEDCSSLFQDLYRMDQLKSRLFAVPLFQVLSCIVFALIFVGLLPYAWPEVFKSFLLSGRKDLFFAGLVPLLLGAISIFFLYRRSKLRLMKEMCFIPFLSYLGLYIRSGQEMESAISRSLSSIDIPFCPPILKFELANRTRTFEERLQNLMPKLDEVWSRFLLGVLWSSRTGRGGLDFIEKIKKIETERIFSQAELRLKADAFVSLLPLVLFCFPSILFLVIGPHFYELYLNWGTWD